MKTSLNFKTFHKSHKFKFAAGVFHIFKKFYLFIYFILYIYLIILNKTKEEKLELNEFDSSWSSIAFRQLGQK